MTTARRTSGFTLIEVILVMGITGLLLSLVVVNMIGPVHRSSLVSTINLLSADMRAQQIRAMSGDNAGANVASPSGILFSQNAYTLFTGQVYKPSDPNNFTVNLAGGLKFTNTLFPGNTLMFASVSGEVVNYLQGQDQTTLSRTDTSEAKTIKINRYGIIISVN